MLTLTAVHVHYGTAPVLHGVDLELAPGQIVCLLGRNGAGKSTTLKAIIGLVRPSAGAITLRGERIDGLAPHAIAGRGLAWVPEERRVFGSLSVQENLRVAAQASRRGRARSPAEVLELFTELRPHAKQRAATLSGGQQQMLAMARALITRPDVMLLDEPTEGLAPAMVRAIRRGILESRSRGAAILLVEQNLQVALSLGELFFILSRGVVVYRGTREALLSRPDITEQHLGVGRARNPSVGDRGVRSGAH